MLYNPVSYYPNKIDEIVFFQDISLEKVEIMNQYDKLISKGKYTEASDYINQQENIYGFFSDFFNLIENRIYNLQEYLMKLPAAELRSISPSFALFVTQQSCGELDPERLNKPSKNQPFLYYTLPEYFFMKNLYIFSNENYIPINNIHIFSDTDAEEDISLLELFSADDENEGNLINTYIYENHEDCDIEESMFSIFLFTNDEQEPVSIDDICIFIDEEEGQPYNTSEDTIWI